MPDTADELRERLVVAFAGELEIGELLGAGGFAAVFRAHDPVLQRDVAIKAVDLRNAPGGHRDQVLDEARVVATVEHPHIVPLYNAEIRGDLLCLTMRLVPGRSLADRIAADGALAPEEAARIGYEVASALAAAHTRGIVHRDIKPANILLDSNGHAIVTDFGIALVTGRSNERRGLVIGTPEYLSPEQALGEAVDGRADVYSLGIVLYEMLTAHLPFSATTTSGTIAKQIVETAPPIATSRPDTPSALSQAVEHALTKSAAQRPTAADFTAELERARLPAAMLAPRVVRRRKRWRRVRWTAAIVIVVAAALGLAVWSVIETYTTLSGGAIPELSASGGDIPGGLVAAARADGSVHPGEHVEYAFIPHGAGWENALLMTDSAIVRRSPIGPRRYPAWEHGSSISLNFARDSHGRRMLLRSTGMKQVDTLYANVSGAEAGILLSAFMDVAKGQDKKARR